MSPPDKADWERATRQLEAMTTISLKIDTATNDWRYQILLVDAKGMPCQSIACTAKLFLAKDLRAMQDDLMTFRAGLAWAYAQGG